MTSGNISVGIVGAGHAAMELMEKLVDADFVDLVGVADLDGEAPGVALARKHNIPTVADAMDLVKGTANLDIIIDVTGVKAVRDRLRAHMLETNNSHTVIMHERIAALLVSLFKGKLVEMKASDDLY